MGYEVRMIIGETHPDSLVVGKYVSVIAMLDLCKIGYDGPLYDLMRPSMKKKSEGWYWYASNGNTKIKKDRYGDFPSPVSLTDVLIS